MTKVERDFETRVLENLDWAESLVGRDLSGIRQMIIEYGAVPTAKMLVDSTNVFDPGFTILAKLGIENLSIEQAVIDFTHSALFTRAEIEAAKSRIAMFANSRNVA